MEGPRKVVKASARLGKRASAAYMWAREQASAEAVTRYRRDALSAAEQGP